MSLLVRGELALADPALADGGQVKDGAVLVEGSRIAAVGRYEELRGAAAEELGGPGFLLMPGLVNAHSHGRGVSTLLQAIPDDALELWLITLELQHRLDPYWNTLYSALQNLRHGVTTILHSHPGQGDEAVYRAKLEASIRGYLDSGLRVSFAAGFKEQNTLVLGDAEGFLASLEADLRTTCRQALLGKTSVTADQYLEIVRSLHADLQDQPRFKLFLGPMGPQWCTDRTLTRAAALAEELGTGLHVHVLETEPERDYGPRVYGRPVLEHLEVLGVLGPRFSAVHAVWLEERDIEILHRTGTSVVHNPASNLRLRSGRAPVGRLLQAGVPVAVGMDSSSLNDDEDLWQEMRLAWYANQPVGLDGTPLRALDVLRMAVTHGARASLWQERIGALEAGREADLVLLDLARARRPYLAPEADLLATALARARGSDVDTVLVGGEVLLRGGRFVRHDLSQIEERLREQAEPFNARAGELRAAWPALREELIGYYRHGYQGVPS